MKKYAYIILCSFLIAYNGSFTVSPDEIFIGDLVEITLKVNSLDDEQRAMFPDLIIENTDISIYHGIINDTIAQYKCQFWSNGEVIFPTQTIYIKDFNNIIIDSLSSG